MEEGKTDPWIREICANIESGEADPDYTVKEDIVYFRMRFCIGPSFALRQTIVEELHNSWMGGHAGYYQTLQRVRQHFFWRGMNNFIHDFFCTLLNLSIDQVLCLKADGIASTTSHSGSGLGRLKHGLRDWIVVSGRSLGDNHGGGPFNEVLSSRKPAGRLLDFLCSGLFH